jgi:hypothetical protein
MRGSILKPFQKEEEEMKASRMKIQLMRLGAIFLALSFLSLEAFSWGAATHAYIEDQLGKKRGLENSNEIYRDCS